MTTIFNRSPRFALTLGLALAAAGIASAQPAAAQTTSGDKAEVSVNYSDLDLSSAAGRSRLESRIAHAADQACGSAPANQMELRQAQQFKACKARAVAKAIAAIDTPNGASLAAK